MKDSVLPSLSINTESNITLTIPSTQAQLSNQGYTYNQAGFTYNQPGVTYGGVYNQNQDVVPLLSSAQIEKPSLNILTDSQLIKFTISQTGALLNEQGYTYNQAGFTYNQIGVAYGGIYNQNQDSVPITLTFADIYTAKVVPLSNNIPLGPGFFLFLPQ
jgi:hypothetical protein